MIPSMTPDIQDILDTLGDRMQKKGWFFKRVGAPWGLDARWCFQPPEGPSSKGCVVFRNMDGALNAMVTWSQTLEEDDRHTREDILRRSSAWYSVSPVFRLRVFASAGRGDSVEKLEQLLNQSFGRSS